MTFKKLNIEEDPSSQGFELGTYDVIVAANVLHVSRSMDRTLANVKSLLKPGGVLVIEEITHMLMRFPMIVGCLPGWWLGTFLVFFRRFLVRRRIADPKTRRGRWSQVGPHLERNPVE